MLPNKSLAIGPGTLTVKLSAFALSFVSLAGCGADPAQTYVVVRCNPATGLNLSAEADSSRPKDAAPEVFDQTSGGYVTHPASTHPFVYAINKDGSGTDTMFLDDGRSVVNHMHMVGKLDKSAMSFTVGETGNVTLISLYPPESLVIVALSGHVVNYAKPIAVGSVYLSHCTFSWGSR